MRHLKTIVIMVASLALAVLLGSAGCGEHHGDNDRHGSPGYERQGNERREERQSDRRDDRGGDSGRGQGERGDR